MLKYVKRYLHFAILAAICMVGEVAVDLLQPKMMTTIVDDGVLGVNTGGVGDMHIILSMGLAMTIVVLIGGLSGSLNNVFVHLTGQNLGNDIRKDCFEKAMKMSFSQMDRFKTGTLVTCITNDVTQAQNMVAQFVRGMIRTGLLFVGSIWFMFRLNIKFGVIVLCCLPFVLLVLVLCLRKSNPMFFRLQAQLDRVNSILQENITGARIVKACVREDYEKHRFRQANNSLVDTQLRVLILFSCMTPLMNIFMNLAVIAIIYVGGIDVSCGSTTPGVIMAAITYATQLLNSVMGLVMLFQTISRGMASWSRLKNILNTESDIQDGTYIGPAPGRGDIEFRGVSFRYPGTERDVLRNINLTINSGETFAILGATGSGKSSLVNLIPRFYDVTEGSILVDGIDVRQYPLNTLRSKVTIALQKSELFTDSIRENLHWGDQNADDASVLQAAEIAQARDFIESTPEGLNTQIAEKGASLSGGQKQRLSIARAVLKNAEILILDDSTSALDLKTEAKLNAALKKARPASTKIIIAQRIPSVRGADRIAVLDGGCIIACGTHRQLMDSCPLYQEIYESQLGKEVAEVG